MKEKLKQNDFDFLSAVLKICPTCKQKVSDETALGQKKVNDVRVVILGWKVVSGIAEDDKEWDRVHFRRNIRPAQQLLQLFQGDVDVILDCIDDCWERIVNKKGLSLSLPGVVKNSDIFRQKWLEGKARRDMGKVA